MNYAITFSSLGLLLAWLPARAATPAYTTNYWVQPVTFTLTAYAQAGSNVLTVSLATKQFLAFLSGVTNTEIITGTNLAGAPVYGTNANFASQSGAELVSKTPILTSSSNTVSVSQPVFAVRFSSGGRLVETPANTFVAAGASYLSIERRNGPGGATSQQFAFGELDFTTPSGSAFNFVGFENETFVVAATPGKLPVRVVKQRTLSVSDYSGQLTGQFQGVTLQQAPTLVTGTISLGSGTME